MSYLSLLFQLFTGIFGYSVYFKALLGLVIVSGAFGGLIHLFKRLLYGAYL